MSLINTEEAAKRLARVILSDIEIYNTSGKRKPVDGSVPTDPVGSWSIELETPLGQNIPATLTISRDGENFSGVAPWPATQRRVSPIRS